MRKVITGALAALSAMLALPALASATPAHLSPVPEGNFALHGGAMELTRKAGGGYTATTLSGAGSFETTTTGTLTLTIHGTKNGASLCTSAGQPTGTVTTTELPFHLVMLGTNQPGILITPGSNEHFFSCGSSFEWGGNGLLGTIVQPECGEESGTMVLRFPGSAGTQQHLIYTEGEYTLKSRMWFLGVPGAWSQSAINAEATVWFGGGATPKIVCT